MLTDIEKKILRFIAFHTYNAVNEKGQIARVPYYILQANFLDPRLEEALNNLLKKKFITDFIWNWNDDDKIIGTRCTEQGFKVSHISKKLSSDQKRELICNKNTISIRYKKEPSLIKDLKELVIVEIPYKEFKKYLEENKNGQKRNVL